MAQRIDWKTMSHADMVLALQEGSEERDERVRQLMDADKPVRRRAANGKSVDAPRGALDEGAS